MTIETSIIIPVRNQKDSLLAALNSLKRQIKKSRNFEIVICDDCSDDGTAEAVKKLHYPIFFKYFVNSPPLGRAANRNEGFQKSVGQSLIFIDGDMVPDESYIEAMLGDNDLDSVKVGHARPSPEEKLSGLEKYLYSRGRYSIMADDSPLPGRFFTSNNFSIGRANFEKLGGFDANFTGWGGEDIDFGLRLEKAGIIIKNAVKAVTYHYHKRTVKSLVDDYTDFGKNSFEYLVNKHPEFLKQIPANILGMSRPRNIADLLFKIISPITINSGSMGLAKAAVKSLENMGCPDFLYDYLFWGSMALGYKKRAK